MAHPTSRAIEARIIAAVLAASLVAPACRPAAEPPNPEPAPAPSPADPAPPSAEPASSPIATAEPAPATSSSAAGPKPMSPEDARTLCETYKAKSKPPTQRPAAMTNEILEHEGPIDRATWSPATDSVFCTIVRERTQTTFQRSESAPCCPQGRRPGEKCPPPTMHTVRGERILVESVELRRDGTVAKTNLATVTRDPHPMPRHMCGRRPGGFTTAARDAESVGAELATMATLEAASVLAFDRLARELAFHGAPAALVQRARRAERDEIRHARVMTALARREGHEPAPFAAEATAVRDLAAIARENATEGCVAEAFGAVLATFQAARAEARLRPTFEAIARDERRHAALAEDVDAWLATQLSAEERASIDEARKVAKTSLWRSLAARSAEPTLGTPGPAEARVLFSAYFDG